jgi:hypothetical protein
MNIDKYCTGIFLNTYDCEGRLSNIQAIMVTVQAKLRYMIGDLI